MTDEGKHANDLKRHWERVYAEDPIEALGWYRPHLDTSLAWIEALGLDPHAPILDVGGGASTLVDDLLARGSRAVTVLDLSAKALAAARARLGEQAGLVTWVEGDITSVELSAGHYALWHDRAVFHFLTEPEQRRRYRARLLAALRPGGHAIIATFAPEAPPRCSGLPVCRYESNDLAGTLGDDLELLGHHKEMHRTPGGTEQMYLYCHFRLPASRFGPSLPAF